MSKIKRSYRSAPLFKGLELPPIMPYQPSDTAMRARDITAQLEAFALQNYSLGVNAESITRCYCFNEYLLGLQFVSYLAAAADAADHHPELSLRYAEVSVTWTTHFVKGLHLNDMLMAKYSDDLYTALMA